MALKLFNTLGRKLQEFTPLNPPQVGLYTCGPTVYDSVHLGNWRTFIFEDLLKRVLIYSGYRVKHVMNITDIDDKIIKRASEENKAISQVAEDYTTDFLTSRDKLNIIPADRYPKATENIAEMIALIEKLIAKGLAYENNGSVYYTVAKFKNYGKLSQISLDNLKSGTRIDNDEYQKDAPADFALWKAARPGEPEYDSPWGKGRPGWHIECSAMSMNELGESFDLHMGGVDLIFPHHENEIAQSEGATGKPFAKYWLEGEHLKIDGEKMSKSLKNIYTLETLAEKKYSPLDFRYLTLTAHYSKQLNFTWESLSSAKKTLTKLKTFIQESPNGGDIIDGYKEQFIAAIQMDLSLPTALAIIWSMIDHNSFYSAADKKATILNFDQILGLGLDQVKLLEIPAEVKELVEARETARKSGDFTTSDQLRDQIEKLGFRIDDSPTGPKIRQK